MFKRFLLMSAALTLLLGGCGFVRLAPGGSLIGSGNYVSKDFAVSGFTGVESSSGFIVTITQGEPFKVTVEAEDNVMDVVRAEKTGSTLRLYLDNKNFTRFSTRRLQASITMPVLTALEASGGSRITIGGFKSDKPLSVDLSGGSTLDGDIEAGPITMEGSGGSRTTLSGKGSELKIDGSGGSRFELGELPVDRAGVELSGGANATVDAQELDYDLSGGSQLRYQGEPVIGQKNTSGGASARPVSR